MFHVSLLEQDIVRMRQMNKFANVPEFEFEPDNNKEYKLEAIQDGAVYAKEANRYLPELLYLVV